jgi:hypothetical protein
VGLTLAVARREGAERWRQRIGGGRRRGREAPVSGGAVLWLEAEAREVAVARRQSREGKITARERGNLAGSGVPFLKGGPVGRQRRGSVGVEQRGQREEEAGHEQVGPY